VKVNNEATARKRPVNLTLNEKLVIEAKTLTGNLSGVVESLLAEFVMRERQERLHKSKAVESAVAAWNEFNVRSGSMSDEYSTL
jgi:antitoxin CcdA